MTQRILIRKSKVHFDQPPIVVGRGAMGEVFLATYRSETVVVKRSQGDMDSLLKEYNNYFKLENHNNILKFFGVMRDSRHSFSLVLEYAPNGNLSSYLKTHTTDFTFKSRVCRDIVLGLMHCHNNNVLHFDLKPENILLDAKLIPKLADFGISKTKSQMVLDHGRAGGTINYVAPERVSRDSKMREYFEKFPKLSDIYSFGLILWSVAKDGEHPYEGLDGELIKDQKRNPTSMISFLKKLPDNTPDDYGTLIMDLTKYNPEERINLAFARLELENLFEEDEDEVVIPETSRWIDDSESDEDEDESPISTSATIETPLTSMKELDSEEPPKSPISKSTERRKSSRSSNASRVHEPKSNSHSNNSNESFRHERGVKIISDRPIVETSPPPLDRLSLDSPVKCKNSSEISPISPSVRHRSSRGDLDIINRVYHLFNRWEELVDTSMILRLENLCRCVGIKPKDLLNIFEENPSESPDYYFAIGFFNEHGFGKATEDPKAAFETYSKAASFGDPRGEIYLGWCYYKGTGTPKDPHKAFQSFQSAADRGCISAQNNVGWCYDIGFGVPSDPVKAFECFKVSGEKGYATAQSRVGLCYEYGRGTTKDLEKALEWYTKAAESGLEPSRKRADEISKMITRRRGKRSSSQWFFDLFRT